MARRDVEIRQVIGVKAVREGRRRHGGWMHLLQVG